MNDLFGETVKKMQDVTPKGRYDSITKNGYKLNEVVSSLQKEIRRCNEARALFWAYEMLPKYYRYLWRRLAIIASEELAWDDRGIEIVNACRNSYIWEIENSTRKQGDIHLVARAVLYLARQPKSREVNDYVAMVHHYADDLHANNKKLPHASYAIDGHTDKSLSKQKTWWEYSRRVTNRAEKPNRYFNGIYEYEGKIYDAGWVKEEVEFYEKINSQFGLKTQPFNACELEAKEE